MKIRNRNLAKKGPLLFFLPSQAPIWVAFPQPLAADRGPVEGGRRWGNRDTLDTLVTRGTKEPLGTRETRETRETRGNSETRQARETRGTRETREIHRLLMELRARKKKAEKSRLTSKR